jgi:hypothetical protein
MRCGSRADAPPLVRPHRVTHGLMMVRFRTVWVLRKHNVLSRERLIRQQWHPRLALQTLWLSETRELDQRGEDVNLLHQLRDFLAKMSDAPP